MTFMNFKKFLTILSKASFPKWKVCCWFIHIYLIQYAWDYLKYVSLDLSLKKTGSLFLRSHQLSRVHVPFPLLCWQCWLADLLEVLCSQPVLLWGQQSCMTRRYCSGSALLTSGSYNLSSIVLKPWGKRMWLGSKAWGKHLWALSISKPENTQHSKTDPQCNSGTYTCEIPTLKPKWKKHSLTY